MLSAVLALALAGAPAVSAESTPSADACLALLERALAKEKAPELAACLAGDVRWQDSEGVVSGRTAALARLDGLRAKGLSFEGAPRRVGLSDLTILSSLSSPTGAGLRRLVAIAGRPPWRSLSVFWAERGWPFGELDAKAPASTSEQLRAAIGAFNDRFGRGDVAGWTSAWSPEALFYSFAGPYRGKDIAYFFEHQKQRYRRPRMTVASARPGPTPDSFVTLQRLSGVCRANGRPFDMPMLLLLELRDGKIRLAYEAFAADGDGCGAF